MEEAGEGAKLRAKNIYTSLIGLSWGTKTGWNLASQTQKPVRI